MSDIATDTPSAASSPVEAPGLTARSPDAVPHGQSGSQAWQQWMGSATPQERLDAWLRVLVEELGSIDSALVLLADADGSFVPAAVHPPGRPMAHLSDIAREALERRDGVTTRDEAGRARCAYPLLDQGDLLGSVVIDLGMASEATVARALRLCHLAAGWLLLLTGQRSKDEQRQRLARAGFLLDMNAGVMATDGLREAMLGMVNRIAREFVCRQVQLGLEKGSHLRVIALSNAAWFDEKTTLVNLAAQAMNEAFDLREMVLWPPPQDGRAQPTPAHARYAEESGSATLASLPLESGAQLVGVLLLERSAPFSPDERELLRTLALAVAPVVEQKRRADEHLLRHAQRSLRWLTRRVVDTSHSGIKLSIGLCALVLLLLSIVPVQFRLKAPASVEGTLQRAAVAPFDGFLREAPVRAGETVRAGQLLARLEDRELKLEQVRWESEMEVALRKEREAMAVGNRVNQRLAAAQANQARAQLGLAEEKLARVEITAPFDAVVVKGDLSQQLGSPVEQGKVLFELAPLDAWRVVLKVDERDISRVALASSGELVLSSLPGEVWPFKVRRITPIAVAEDGRNYYRVEADLGQAVPKLSPNMEGVAKIDAGRRSLMFIWTRRMVDWMRLAWWKVTP